jgi:hypothetical protein
MFPDMLYVINLLRVVKQIITPYDDISRKSFLIVLCFAIWLVLNSINVLMDMCKQVQIELSST